MKNDTKFEFTRLADDGKIMENQILGEYEILYNVCLLIYEIIDCRINSLPLELINATTLQNDIFKLKQN